MQKPPLKLQVRTRHLWLNLAGNNHDGNPVMEMVNSLAKKSCSQTLHTLQLSWSILPVWEKVCKTPTNTLLSKQNEHWPPSCTAPPPSSRCPLCFCPFHRSPWGTALSLGPFCRDGHQPPRLKSIRLHKVAPSRAACMSSDCVNDASPVNPGPLKVPGYADHSHCIQRWHSPLPPSEASRHPAPRVLYHSETNRSAV